GVRGEDRPFVGAGDGGRRLYRPRATRGRRRGRAQRDPEEPHLCLGAGAPFRAQNADPRRQGPGPGDDGRRARGALRAAVRDQGAGGVEFPPVTERVSTGLPKLDAMLCGGLLPGTLTVAYGATGIGKTHLGLTFADHGRIADGARGIVLDLNGRGDSQQHDEYAARLFGWSLTPWTHTVTPMTDPYPPPGQMDASYSNTLKWVGRVRDYQVPT